MAAEAIRAGETRLVLQYVAHHELEGLVDANAAVVVTSTSDSSKVVRH